MSGGLWIEVRKWNDFQHYKNREPKWIKLYTELQHDDNWLELTGHQRAVLVGIWLEYASARCQLRLDTASLTRRLGLRVTRATLESLNHAGFIRFVASKPLALARSREVEKEKNVVKGFKRTLSRAIGNHDDEELFEHDEEHIEELERWPR